MARCCATPTCSAPTTCCHGRCWPRWTTRDRRRVPATSDWLAHRVAGAVARLRGLDLAKAPGVAEAINWASALHALGVPDLDVPAAERTLGAVLKYAEDAEVVHAAGLARVVG